MIDRNGSQSSCAHDVPSEFDDPLSLPMTPLTGIINIFERRVSPFLLAHVNVLDTVRLIHNHSTRRGECERGRRRDFMPNQFQFIECATDKDEPLPRVHDLMGILSEGLTCRRSGRAVHTCDKLNTTEHPASVSCPSSLTILSQSLYISMHWVHKYRRVCLWSQYMICCLKKGGRRIAH